MALRMMLPKHTNRNDRPDAGTGRRLDPRIPRRSNKYNLAQILPALGPRRSTRLRYFSTKSGTNFRSISFDDVMIVRLESAIRRAHLYRKPTFNRIYRTPTLSQFAAKDLQPPQLMFSQA